MELPRIIHLMNCSYIAMINSGTHTQSQIDAKKKELILLYKEQKDFRENKIKILQEEIDLMDEQIENGLIDYQSTILTID